MASVANGTMTGSGIAVGVVIEERRHQDVPQRTLGRRRDRRAPDDELDVAGRQQVGAEPVVRPRRASGGSVVPGEDAAIDLDDGVARDRRCT